MSNDFNVLICGSQKFQDKSFVFGMLDALIDSGLPISNIVIGKFAGACEFAKKWVEKQNESTNSKQQKIGIKDFDYDMFLGHSNLSLYENLNIPDVVLNTDKFFLNGKEQVIKKDIKLVLAFPNPEGDLGPSTKNIVRFASMARVKHLDCSEALNLIQEHRREVEVSLYNKKTETAKPRLKASM